MYSPNIMKKVSMSWLLIFVCQWVYPDNMIFNSGFELGSAGFQCIKNLRPDTNPELLYEGAVADASTSKSGKQSLRIPNRFAEAVYFSSYFYAEKVKPETAYTLSVWLKSSADNYPVVLIARSSTRWTTYGTRIITTGKEWTRYVLNFQTDKQDDYFRFVMLCGKESAPCNIWLDDLEVTADSAAKDDTAAEIEGCTKINTLFIQDGALKEIPASVELVNNRSRRISFLLAIAVTNKFYQNKVFTKNISIDLPANEKKSFDFAIPADIGYGSYSVTLSVDNTIKSKFLHGMFAIAGQYQPRPVDIDKAFCLSLNDQGGEEGLCKTVPFWAYHWTKVVPDFTVAEGTLADSPLADRYDLLKTLGCRLLRLWSPGNIRWRDIEPEEGTFDFTPIDRTLQFTEKFNLSTLLVLGNMDFMDVNTGKEYANGSLPEWLKTKSEVREKFPIKKKYSNGRVYLPPLALWERYVKKVVTHCGDRVTHYEIMNEPNLIFSDPNDYLVYAKVAGDILKEYGKRRVGPCTTGDLGGQATTFLGQFITGKGLDFVDIVSFHPYDAKELSSSLPADKQIQTFKSLIMNNQAEGAQYPLWNTELYFLRAKSTSTQVRDCQPYHPARRILIDVGEGVRQSINQTVSSLWNTEFHPGQMEYPQIIEAPSDVYVSLNTIARFFEGAEPVDKIRWAYDCICYVYKRNNRYLAAYWNYGELKTDMARLAIRMKDSVALYDMFGNKLAFTGESLPLGNAPCYVLNQTPVDDDNFIRALKSAEINTSAVSENKIARETVQSPVKLLIDDFESSKKWITGSTVKDGPTSSVEVVGSDTVQNIPQGVKVLKVAMSAETFVEGSTTHMTPCARTTFNMNKIDASELTLSFWIRTESDVTVTIGLPKKDWSDRLFTALRLKSSDGWRQISLSLGNDFKLSEKKWGLKELNGELWIYNRAVAAGGSLNPAVTLYLDEIVFR